VAFKLRYHEDALADLEMLFDWSRDQHPGSTELFANDLFNHLDLLPVFPYIGVVVESEPSVRRLLHSPLHVYYRVDEARGAVEILHFWHASRQPPSFLK
jgi:plasmid stabilization system protein ParE